MIKQCLGWAHYQKPHVVRPDMSRPKGRDVLPQDWKGPVGKTLRPGKPTIRTPLRAQRPCGSLLLVNSPSSVASNHWLSTGELSKLVQHLCLLNANVPCWLSNSQSVLLELLAQLPRWLNARVGKTKLPCVLQQNLPKRIYLYEAMFC